MFVHTYILPWQLFDPVFPFLFRVDLSGLRHFSSSRIARESFDYDDLITIDARTKTEI
jgi:hypothetical protein